MLTYLNEPLCLGLLEARQFQHRSKSLTSVIARAVKMSESETPGKPERRRSICASRKERREASLDDEGRELSIRIPGDEDRKEMW